MRLTQTIKGYRPSRFGEAGEPTLCDDECPVAAGSGAEPGDFVSSAANAPPDRAMRAAAAAALKSDFLNCITSSSSSSSLGPDVARAQREIAGSGTRFPTIANSPRQAGLALASPMSSDRRVSRPHQSTE